MRYISKQALSDKESDSNNASNDKEPVTAQCWISSS